MADERPRILQSNRDIVLSLVVLMVICAAFAGLVGQCSFSPKGPSQGEIPHYDAAGGLALDAKELPFPIRLPAIPDGWVSNSGRRENVGDQPASRVGFVTPGRSYLELVQTSAPVDAFRLVDGQVRAAGHPIPIRGRQWTVFTGADGVRTAWALDEGDGSTVGLVGDAPQNDFETLAAAVQDAPPLPSS